MKTRFTTVDIKAVVFELNTKLLGLRVVNVYDVDNKTYLIKLAKPDAKEVLLLESGNRFHTTDFEWPKSIMPSGFSMKMRKHLKSRRLESIAQVGEDRIVDFQFGSGEAAYHIVLELYDRGNIVLTDFEYTILNILRPRTDDSQDVRFAVREKYPLECAKKPEGAITAERLTSILELAKTGDNLRKFLLPHLAYGPAVIDHCLLVNGLSPNAKIGKDIDPVKDIERLTTAMSLADTIMANISSGCSRGYIIQQREKKPTVQPGSDTPELLTYSEFHPMLFTQHEASAVPYIEFESFNKAVDEFFSKIESQKLDVKLLQQEKAALKKLANVKNDHFKRLEELEQEQSTDVNKAQLIEINLSLVDRAIAVVRSLLASQLDWLEIEKVVTEAATQGDAVASCIKSLKLQTNHITMLLHPKPSVVTATSDSEDEGIETLKPTKVDIDLGLSAYANARKYFDMKRHAAQKQQKTINASQKALKSAERKTKQTLKEVQTTATINKARKTYWFEKFLWCISSENYLLIGGRDQQQNEMIVKRYMRPGDLYVHADLHGASSIVIKNPTKEPVPPKTLNEAGTMALCYSAAWDAKVITSAWWVYHDQVSKTAPTGEYLTTGSFMIRGKKNYLSPSYLVYGFGFLFKLDESCVEAHKNERRIRTLEEEDAMSSAVAVGVAAAEADAGEIDQISTSEQADNENSDDDDDDSENSAGNDDGNSVKDGGSDAEQGENSDEDDVENLDENASRNPEGFDGGKIGGDGSDEKKETASSSGVYKPTCGYHTELRVSDFMENFAPVVKSNPGLGAEKQDDSGSADENPGDFPDTSIALEYVGGNKFTLQTNIVRSHSSDTPSTADDKLIFAENEGNAKSSVRLSAKQRREMKKSRQRVVQFEMAPTGGATNDNDNDNVERQPSQQSSVKSSDKVQQTQLKRGQKSKIKKIQEKYADQDEDERMLRLQILASAGAPKEDTKAKKGKKGKAGGKSQSMTKPPTQPQKGPNGKGQGQRPPGRLTIDDIQQETPVAGQDDEVAAASAPVDPASLITPVDAPDDEDDTATSTQDTAILDSLTGLPGPEDILLFCVAVCAPYSALSNYRYKVKLVPGSTKRGKAVKISLETFSRDRTATPREKDLFRSVKDADLSRNMPGKVKVSAPNLHKQKHK